MANKKITVVIPCLNEGVGLNSILKNIPDIVNEVIVVDGNSTDNSVGIARNYGAKVIIQKKRGYGLALRTGFNSVKNDIIVSLDGDSTYPAEDIPKLYKYFAGNNLDFLVACRFPLKHRHAMTVKNFFGNLLLSSITSLVFNFQVTDVCSGMWMISRKAWRVLEPRIEDNKWFFSNEIKIEAIKDNNILYDEKWIELRARSGETKVGNVWLIGLNVLFLILKKRFF